MSSKDIKEEGKDYTYTYSPCEQKECKKNEAANSRVRRVCSYIAIIIIIISNFAECRYVRFARSQTPQNYSSLCVSIPTLPLCMQHARRRAPRLFALPYVCPLLPLSLEYGVVVPFVVGVWCGCSLCPWSVVWLHPLSLEYGVVALLMSFKMIDCGCGDSNEQCQFC